MKCPYCQQAVTEGTQQCPHCRFSLGNIGGTFGRLPRLSAGINDLSDAFSWSDRRRLAGFVTDFSRQFPQITFHIVAKETRAEYPMAPYAFWLFNAGDLCGELDKGGLNFHVLLLIDPKNERSHFTVGYGLEPFISTEMMERIIEAGEEDMRHRRFADAAIEMVKRAGNEFSEMATEIPRIYGIRPRKLSRARG